MNIKSPVLSFPIIFEAMTDSLGAAEFVAAIIKGGASGIVNLLPAMVIRVGLVAWNASTTIGIRIPKVPQEVPFANARKQPTRKMIAGSRFTIPGNQPDPDDHCYLRLHGRSCLR